MKKPALQNKQVASLRLAFRARKVFGTFKKQHFTEITDGGQQALRLLPATS